MTTTPTDLTITSRPLNAGRNAINARWWHGGDPVATAFFNALSATFPLGETFFIEAVRRYRDQADPKLKEQISAFVDQEAMHTREHLAFNRLVKNCGYDLTTLDAHIKKRIELARSRHPIGQLAITVALEHFTAIMAHALLTDPDPLPDAPADIRRLWQWHAIEEIEHKAVAFDTYLLATRNLSAWRRWSIRCKVMLFVSFQFWRSNFRHMADLFRQDGINTPLTWIRVAKFVLIKPGIMRRTFFSYLSFYRPAFHPWDHDDRFLIADIERQLAQDARS